MTIPDYQSIMLPLLELASDGTDHPLKEATEAISNTFKLTEEERNRRLPSGLKTYIYDRINWACTYMKQAGLLTSAKRGFFRITERGQRVLKERPGQINVEYLEQFKEFMEFRQRKGTKKTGDVASRIEMNSNHGTPEERLEAAYAEIRNELGREILEKIKECSPEFFERLVVELLLKMGYGGSRQDAGEAVGKSGDEGIDGIIKEDRLGLDVVYIQAKKWKDTVIGRPHIQAFVGALSGQKATKGIFITTSRFSNDAREFTKQTTSRVVLIDGEQLAQYMIDFNIGVSTAETYEMKKIDNDYFEVD